MTDTRKKILDEAQDLMQTRGYAEMTFQEIATRVGIKKPSIVISKFLVNFNLNF